ncbi:Por secretion system C-terminal sorting domain-containing protein [Aquimarina amphilecti]|uniref:Por secretion system C-terminal sorting domain-containing protein n=1 Tax=Aquimarina amphilecti TaxID=1038014 RepID=A0A1H7KK48_AQUAM|nr:GEVED domain-containing protein [Aquimarina amphilecti]SEK86870.1 Por secretion system C-terminal sorting domain-containing protein [Aquimarina amphilecti]
MRSQLFFLFLFFGALIGNAQEKKINKASSVVKAIYLGETPPLAGRTLIPPKPRTGEINPRRTNGSKVVPGKGSSGIDPLREIQRNAAATHTGRAPSLVFEVNSSSSSPTDPTGAVGPNHYVSAKNSSFAIHDRSGNVLVASNSLANIWPGESLGDPIIFYDNYEDRFVITQFSNSPNGFLVAVGQGPDPVNDGWYTYRFNTSSFPDYTKFSIWSDGYYVTANKDQGSQATNEVVFALEREKLLEGDPNAQMVGFSLPGIEDNGFYSPGGFHVTGPELPPAGDMRIVFMQDDSWQGVSDDALKLWTVNVNWENPASSTIAEAEEFTADSNEITDFDSVFDGGSFQNLPQPGGGQNIDAIQSTMMYMTSYRRFCDYNSVVMNFVVDIDDRANSDNIAAIRWYELRQAGDGQPWTVYQEGTYESPDGKSAWCASMAMDAFGNIGMGYTTMGTTANNATADSFASIRYTGRLASDALGTMTIAEQTIAEGSADDVNFRYGDYAQLTVDPIDDQSFWHIGEYFESAGNNARNVVGVFKIATNPSNDVRIVSIDSPSDDTLTNSETVTVTIQNLGTTSQSNIPVSYQVDGGALVDEVFTGSVAAGATASFSFSTVADLSGANSFVVSARTNLTNDDNPQNDCNSRLVKNINAVDLSVSALVAPESNDQLSASADVTITIRNVGADAQSDIPVSYSVNGATVVNGIVSGPLAAGESVDYTFSQTADLSSFGTYSFVLTVSQPGDGDTSNDSITVEVIKDICAPTSDCSFGDNIVSFVLSDLSNTGVVCNTGYEDFRNLTATLEIATDYDVTVQSGFANDDDEKFSLWIDFNDNSTFEPSEQLVTDGIITAANTDVNFLISIPADAPIGDHLMRARVGDTSFAGDLNDPCNSMSYGSTHDYTVSVGIPLSVPDFASAVGELIVISAPEDKYNIQLSTEFEGRLTFNVLTLSGQILVSNYITKNGKGVYEYDLDMSYAASGIYIISMGDSSSRITDKIIVR